MRFKTYFTNYILLEHQAETCNQKLLYCPSNKHYSLLLVAFRFLPPAKLISLIIKDPSLSMKASFFATKQMFDTFSDLYYTFDMEVIRNINESVLTSRKHHSV